MAIRRMARFGVLLAALAWAAGAASAGQVNPGTDAEAELRPPAPSESFTVAILADRTTGDDAGLAVLRQAVRELNLLEPDLVLHIGDLVPGYIRDMARWEQDAERVKAILAELDPPFFPLAGNHDVITGTGNPHDRRGEELHKRHFGPLYYSFDHRYAHFVCLYTEEALQSQPRFSNAQLQWLREDLARSKARHVFVLMHKPVWESSSYPDANWAAVEEILRGHPVRAVIAGHFHHYYKSQNRHGAQYYVIGVTGGQLFSPELAGGLEHYVLLRIRPDGYRLALVRPGHILPDDYITMEDFKNAEKLRFLSREQSGVASAVRSPESGDVDEKLAVVITNPLDRSLPVVVRGVPRGGWRFSPAARRLLVEPGERLRVSLGIRCAQVVSDRLVVPEVEIEYAYTDGRERTVPIELTRRVPLRRIAAAPLTRPGIELDGRPSEAAWRHAAVLRTARWHTSPYESDEPGPVFRILHTGAGIHFYAESPDADVSDFRGDRMLSDAIFVGAFCAAEEGAATDLEHVPVVIVYPFSQPGPEQAVRAFWDPKRPAGLPAHGIHVAPSILEGGKGWACEGFVPWDQLLADGALPDSQVSFNIGAWDNDGDLFTELHSWAPTGDASQWGRLILRATPEE